MGVGREGNGHRSKCTGTVKTFVETYCASMAEFAREPILAMARHQIRREQLFQPIHAALLTRLMQADSSGQPRIREQRPEFWRLRAAAANYVLASLPEYRSCFVNEMRRGIRCSCRLSRRCRRFTPNSYPRWRSLIRAAAWPKGSAPFNRCRICCWAGRPSESITTWSAAQRSQRLDRPCESAE
jgi:hypothetical protein